MKVTLAGIGMDGNRTLTKEAAEAISRADLLIGAARMLSPFAESGKRQETCYDFEKIAQILQNAADAGDVKEAAVLLSGDTGFFSGAKKLLTRLEETGGDLDVSVLPGISSLAALCAKTGLSCEEMKIVSLHGRKDHIAVHVLRNEKTFFLLGGKVDAAALCRCLTRYSLGQAAVYVGENLGTETERVTSGTADELCQLKTQHLAVAIVCNPAPLRYLPCGIDDDAFLRVIRKEKARDKAAEGGVPAAKSGRDTQEAGSDGAPAAVSAAKLSGRTIPMTKSEVRAVAVAKLRIREDDICWDVGCGTGSVSVEMALRCPGGCVYGYDKNEAAAALTMENARKFSCDNIRTAVCGFPPRIPADDPRTAQAALSDDPAVQTPVLSQGLPQVTDPASAPVPLPVPDAVFVGGAGGRVAEIVSLACGMNPDVRIVITAVTLETLEAARTALTQAFGGCGVTQLSVAKAQRTGSISMLRAHNPVFILEGARV